MSRYHMVDKEFILDALTRNFDADVFLRSSFKVLNDVALHHVWVRPPKITAANTALLDREKLNNLPLDRLWYGHGTAGIVYSAEGKLNNYHDSCFMYKDDDDSWMPLRVAALVLRLRNKYTHMAKGMVKDTPESLQGKALILYLNALVGW